MSLLFSSSASLLLEEKNPLVKHTCDMDSTSKEQNQGRICVAKEAKYSALRKSQREHRTIEIT